MLFRSGRSAIGPDFIDSLTIRVNIVKYLSIRRFHHALVSLDLGNQSLLWILFRLSHNHPFDLSLGPCATFRSAARASTTLLRVRWFLNRGLVNTGPILLSALLSLYIYRKDLRHILRLVAGSITFIVVCNNMLWYLLGSLWRFSTAGRVASTERLTRNDSMSNYEWHDYLEAMSEASGY